MFLVCGRFKAQVSLELALIFSAMLVFFALMVPSIQKASSLSSFVVSQSSMWEALLVVSLRVEEAAVLGEGTSFSGFFFLPQESEVYYEDSFLFISSRFEGRVVVLKRSLTSSVYLNKGILTRGTHSFTVVKTGGEVFVFFD